MSNALLCGIDEAGRGPLAGAVFAAAVIVAENFNTRELADSKKLSEKKRKELSEKIFSECLYGVGTASVKEIDTLNILNATMLAMKRAYNSLIKKLSLTELSALSVIVDGNRTPDIPNCSAKIKADAQFAPVMAASIIAKHLRDQLMIHYGKKFPEYGFEQHKGYCTKAHVAAIHKYGNSAIQRKSFTVPKA